MRSILEISELEHIVSSKETRSAKAAKTRFMLPDDKEEPRGSKSKDCAAVNEIKSTKKMQAEAKKQRQNQVKQELEVGNKSFY